MSRSSEKISELAKALCKAQSAIQGATKDKTNPHYQSKYADLAACWDAGRAPLTSNGLSVVQFPRLTEAGVEIETILMHTSGEWMSDTLTVPLAKRDAHGLGAAITYGRRFAFSSVVSICPEDDDGNAAVKGGEAKVETAWTPELQDLASEAASKGMVSYKQWWESLSKETRVVLATGREHHGFKATAIKVDTLALAAAAKEPL